MAAKHHDIRGVSLPPDGDEPIAALADRQHAVVPIGNSARSGTRRLHPDDITTIDNIPVTTLARTLIDLAAIVHPNTLVKAIEASERRQRFDLRATDAAIARGPTRHGVRRLTKALAAYRPPPTTKSHVERNVLKALHARGIPEPHINTTVHGEEADLHFPHAHLIVELDGTPYHRSPRELANDRRTDLIWHRNGELVLRFTDDQLEHNMNGAIDDITALYKQRSRLRPPRPPGPRE